MKTHRIKQDEKVYNERREKRIKSFQKGLQYNNINFIINYPVLDIGGGDGFFLEFLNVKEADILGFTDLRNRKYNYIEWDIANRLPRLSKKYKTIFITEVLEHLHNPLYLLAQVYDILDLDGKCYISFPYTKLFTKEHSSGEWDKGHISRWKLKEIKEQVAKLGFKYKVLKKRRRFRNTAFFLPHCWIVMELSK